MSKRNATVVARGLDLRAWRARKYSDVVLPSGLGVTLKRVTLLDLVSLGCVPTPLLGMVDELTGNARADTAPGFRAKDLKEYTDVVNVVVRAALVCPKITESVGPDTEAGDDSGAGLGIDELEFSDRVFIFNWANQGAASAAPFPTSAPASERTDDAGGEVRAETE